MPDLNEDYLIRIAAARDAGIIGEHRAAMFRDMGLLAPQQYESLRKASESWIAGLYANGQYVGWLVEHQTAVVAGGGILLRESFPVPECCRVDRWAHIVNVYTDPNHRRRGLARRLMKTMLDWCAIQAIGHVTLAASDEGRPLYEDLGFTPTNDMKLRH
jgi:GNAT superfamily N-acetyltransferase